MTRFDDIQARHDTYVHLKNAGVWDADKSGFIAACPDDVRWLLDRVTQLETAVEKIVELQARNRNLEAVSEAVEPLVSACEEEFTSTDTEIGEFRQSDGEEVAAPSSQITFGMIRAARAALAVLEEPQ